jgi:hypothetical protein
LPTCRCAAALVEQGSKDLTADPHDSPGFAPIIIKGILDADAAREAAAAEVDGIIFSNHGGRPLDGRVFAVRASSTCWS